MTIIDKEKNKNYWDNKFWAYMHDPFDKCFDIKGHEKRAAEIQNVFGLTPPNEEFWKRADGIASGFERGQIVSYHKNEEKSGAIDFIKKPILTHPTGEKCHIEIDFSGTNTSSIFEKMLEFIKKDIGVEAGKGGYSDNFKNDNKKFQIARFLYTHLVLRFRLANENVAGLGGLWHRLPADTRFPDHSIWQHNSLVSAINSCFELGGEDDLGMMVVSITPVQSFIEKARKLRDYWTGSIFLSYLAFEGIRWVIENLGPDHILYPSLIDQFLVNEYLRINWKLSDGVNFLNKESDIASFPNKFLFLLPFSKSEECAKEITESIKSAWRRIYQRVMEGIINNLNHEEKQQIEKLFERQNENFWDIKWASVKMLSESDKETIEKLLPETTYSGNFKLLEYFNNMIADKKHYQKSGIGTLYSVSHVLCQSVLAAEKTKKQITRAEEPGEKCHLCGEFEVLHKKPYENNMSANDYKKSVQEFWKDLKEMWDGEDGSDIKENERLCSICLTKRLGYYFLKDKDKHLLSESFKKSKNFPSTTYIALTDYFKRENVVKLQEKMDLAQEIHESDDVTTEGRDKYYAILLMDGDNMGKLINGETIASTWESIMHPDIFEKLKNSEAMDEKYTKNWREIFEKVPKRNITPSIHASISESLGDFAIYGVAKIVKKYDGRLIYAGGDDVCAILPIDCVLDAAEEISSYYTSSFKLIYSEKGEIVISDVSGKFKPSGGKLSVNLGRGKDISISAGILICHHKESLKHMIRESHELLDMAKKDGGRNAVAIQLKKRSGGDRFFISKWNDKKLDSFKYLIGKMGKDMSRSLAYRLAEFEKGIDSILNLKDYQEEEKNKLLSDFILTMLERSGKKSDDPSKLAENISNLILDYKDCFTNEPLIIAGFLHNEDDKGCKDDNKGGKDGKLV